MKRPVEVIGCVFVVVGLLTAWLCLGVFQDREFSTLYLFRKHRLSPKFFFYAPIGESDRKLEDLPLGEQKEETAFVEFVYKGGGYYRKIRLFNY